MQLTEFHSKIKSSNLVKLLQEDFDFNIDLEKLSLNNLRKLHESTVGKLSSHRYSHDIHSSEKNFTYSGLIVLENLLSQYISEAPSQRNRKADAITRALAKKKQQPHLADPQPHVPPAVQQQIEPEQKQSVQPPPKSALPPPVPKEKAKKKTKPGKGKKAPASANSIKPKDLLAYGKSHVGGLLKSFHAGFKGHPMPEPMSLVSKTKNAGKILSNAKFANIPLEKKQQIAKVLVSAQKYNSAAQAEKVEKAVDPTSQAISVTKPANSQVVKDVYDALLGLGYKKTDAKNMVRNGIDKHRDSSQKFDELLALVLKDLPSIPKIKEPGVNENKRYLKSKRKLNTVAIQTESDMNKNTKTIGESLIKLRAKRFIAEGEMENAEAALAAKDMVDRLQDTIEELGKMSNEELPHLIDAIRNSFGQDKASAYQSAANEVLSGLLDTVKEKKTSLENATLALTGDAVSAGDNLGLDDGGDMEGEAGIDGAEDLGDEMGGDAAGDLEAAAKKSPLGRETRPEAGMESRNNKGRKLEESKLSVSAAQKKYDSAKNAYGVAKEKAALKGITRSKSVEVEKAQMRMNKASDELSKAKQSEKKLTESKAKTPAQKKAAEKVSKDRTEANKLEIDSRDKIAAKKKADKAKKNVAEAAIRKALGKACPDCKAKSGEKCKHLKQLKESANYGGLHISRWQAVLSEAKKKEDVCNMRGCNKLATSNIGAKNGYKGGNYCSGCVSKINKKKATVKKPEKK